MPFSVKLQDLLQQDGFDSAGQEAMLNVVATSSWITNGLAALVAPYEITPAQYNVLRILLGRHPRPVTCSEIGERLLDRTPDVTRLLNRLEKSQLVERQRSKEDRRVVHVTITSEGLALLDRLNPVVRAWREDLMDALSEDEQQRLSELLERLRVSQQRHH